MGPKKKKGNDDKKDELKMIDREFYVLQIEDLNRKVARLESKCTELETENEVVRANMEKLDEDRGDVISHLKRVLQRKVDEVSELTERIDALHMSKEKDEALYKEKIKNMESDFKQMHEQLSSEIKLLNGKLNSMEEFRAQREDLMSKFEKQEIALEEQEKRHDQQLLDLEQSYLVRKERLKEEMETRLLKLSLDFQKATQMRIASTTQSVIRENIAVNNQLNILVAEWKKMCEEMDQLKNFNKNLIINEEINRKERRVVERKNIIQAEVIKQLSNQEVGLKERALMLKQINKQMVNVESQLTEAKRRERAALNNLGLAKQQIHSLAIRYNELKTGLNRLQSHCFKLENVLSKATVVSRHLIQFPTLGSEEGIIIKRVELLNTLVELLDWEATSEKLAIHESSSVQTLPIDKSLEAKYHTGDLGIVPSAKETIIELQDEEATSDIRKLKEERNLKENQIKKLLEGMKQAQALVNEIKLLPDAQTRLLKEDVKLRREQLLDVLFKTLDLSLVQTSRPLPLSSLETVILDSGMVKEHVLSLSNAEKMKEYEEYPSKTECEDNLDKTREE